MESDQEEFNIQKELDTLRKSIQDISINLHKYIKQESVIQEQTDTELIYQILRANLPTLRIYKTHDKEFYNYDGSLITDFDGCIRITSRHTVPDRQSNSRFRSNTTLKNNSVSRNHKLEYNKAVIIESKHSLDIAKVNKKIIQFSKIIVIIKNYKKIEIKSKKFKIFESMLDSLGDDLYMVFSSNDTPLEIKNYILAINSGITENEYEKHIFTVLHENEYYNKFLKKSKIPNILKKKLESINTISELKVFLYQEEMKIYSVFFEAYCISYSEIKDIFNFVKGRLGVLQFGSLQLPSILGLEQVSLV